MVDDLLATGGTMEGSSRLIEQEGGIIVGYAFVIELVDLKGRKKLDHPIFSLVTFEGEWNKWQQKHGLQIKKLRILKPLVGKSGN